MELDRHFIKEKLEGILTLNHVPTHQQGVDILTKVLTRIKFEMTSKLGMINIYSKLEGEC